MHLVSDTFQFIPYSKPNINTLDTNEKYSYKLSVLGDVVLWMTSPDYQ